MSLEVRLAKREAQSRSGREQSIVTETEAPRGSQLLLTDKHVRDEGWSRECQCAVCGATRSGTQFFVHQPEGGVGLFERAHVRAAYLCLAYEGDGGSISRSQVGQWRQDDKAPGDQILVFEWRALLGGEIERPNFGPENQILVS